MTEPIRSVWRNLHHLPWIAAGLVLAAGLVVYATRPSVRTVLTTPAPETPEGERPVFRMDEDTFRKSLKLDELYESSFLDSDR